MTMYQDRIIELRRMRAGDLRANPKNWRRHPKAQQDAMRGVLEEVGFADALLAYQTPEGLTLVDGHLRAGLDPDQEVPVLILDLDEAEAEKLLVTLDPLAAMAETDHDSLAQLLQGVSFDDGSLNALLASLASDTFQPLRVEGQGPEVPSDEEDATTTADAIEEVEAEAYVPFSERGQVWVLGDHRLMCGDSTAPDAIATLMGGETAALIAADPPYGMGKENEGVANDNLYRERLDAFQMAWWNAARKHVDDNGSAYIWGNSEDLWRLWYAGGLKDSERLTFRNEVTWWKGGGGMRVGTSGSRMYEASERCLFFMLGEQGFKNNTDNYWDGWEGIRSVLMADVKKMEWTAEDVQRITGVGMFGHWFTKSQWEFIPEHHYKALQAAAREHDAFKREHDDLKREHDAFKREHDDLKREFYATRAYFDNIHENMTDVWSFPRVTGEERYGHTTPKPVAMIERIVKSSSADNATILDPFLGSGTTIIAAEKLGRRCYAMEIEPRYVDVAIRRWEAFTGKKAELLT